MKYKTVISGKVVTIVSDDEAYIFNRVKNLLRQSGARMTDDQIKASIARQSVQKPTQNKISLADAVKGASALIKYSVTGGESAQEIRRRSAICLECPLVSSVSGCSSCGMAGKATKFMNSLKSKLGLEAPIPSEVKNLFCGFCQCSIPLLVVTKESDFKEESPEKNSTRPDKCWMKK